MSRSKIEKIEVIRSFEKDLKKHYKDHRGSQKQDTDALMEAINAIANNDQDKLKQLKDHGLKGNWKGYRELHIESDWLLVYFIDETVNELVLVLTRTGSHDFLLKNSKIPSNVISSYKSMPRIDVTRSRHLND